MTAVMFFLELECTVAEGKGKCQLCGSRNNLQAFMFDPIFCDVAKKGKTYRGAESKWP